VKWGIFLRVYNINHIFYNKIGQEIFLTEEELPKQVDEENRQRRTPSFKQVA
jgi:hypothetical protein